MENNILFLNICITTLIFFFLEPLAKILNLYDFPDKRKLHREKTPLIGGFILILNLIFFSLLYFFEQYDEQNQNYFFASKNNFIVFLLSISVIFLLGAFDDKLNLNPNLKLFLLTIIISLTLWFDSSLIIYSLNFSFLSSELFLGKYSFIFSVLCFLLFINACNMFDGINLQSSSYFIILILYLIIIGINNDLINIILFSLILIFILNRNGKIFMGDSGVYLLAFIFSYILIKIYNFVNNLK